LAWAHPDLRFVDFISFSERSRKLLSGTGWLQGDYPLGYPALLLLGKRLLGDALLAGKLLAVSAGILAVFAAQRLKGAAAATWLLALSALLTWGSTEGTDMPAAALALASLAAVADRSYVLAGALAGLACMMRYTALAVVPVVLFFSRDRLKVLLAFAAATAPHWGVALAMGASVWPDGSDNVGIAAGHPTRLWSWETLLRWPRASLSAARISLASWPVRIAFLGLLVGLLRRDRRAAMLLAWWICHLGLLGLFFGNFRLVLPATLAAGLGAAWLMPRRWLLLPALGLLAWNIHAGWEVPRKEAERGEVAAATRGLEGPYLSSSPWFYWYRQGWVRGSVPVRALHRNPRAIDPPMLRAWALEHGFSRVVVDPGRIHVTYWGLEPLLQHRAPEGYERELRVGGWRVYRFVP